MKESEIQRKRERKEKERSDCHVINVEYWNNACAPGIRTKENISFVMKTNYMICPLIFDMKLLAKYVWYYLSSTSTPHSTFPLCFLSTITWILSRLLNLITSGHLILLLGYQLLTVVSRTSSRPVFLIVWWKCMMILCL